MKNYPQIQAALKNTRSKVKVKKQRSSNIARIDKAFICNISNVAKQKGEQQVYNHLYYGKTCIHPRSTDMLTVMIENLY